jgi:hypothetical protein
METTWVSNGNPVPGRLDLLVDTGTRLIGVENKIWASFMTDQPVKYCASLIDSSQTLGRRQKSLLAVLAPKAKEPHVQEALRQVRESGFSRSIDTESIYWTTLLDCLASVDLDSSPTESAYQELRKYVEHKYWVANYVDVFDGLRSWDGDWNDHQRQLVRYLWYVFPSPGPKLNNTSNWHGYPFFTDRDDVWGWFGFVRTGTELREYDQMKRNNAVEFVINYQRDGSEASHAGERFKDVTFDPRSWKERGWLVDFDQSWSTFLIWSDLLTDAIEAIGGTD